MRINNNRAWRGRDKARESIFGNMDKSYDYTECLRLELLRRNPGSHVDVMLETNKAFLRMFVNLNASIDRFKSGCRSFIGLNLYHLRSMYLGIMLSASASDGNNGLFPVAFAIVEGESRNTWHWFIKKLLTTFQGNLQDISFISDQEKGLQDAV